MIRRIVSLFLLVATFTAASAQEAAVLVPLPEARIVAAAQSPAPYDSLPAAPLPQPPAPQQAPQQQPFPPPRHQVSRTKNIIVLGAIIVTAVVLVSIYATQRD